MTAGSASASLTPVSGAVDDTLHPPPVSKLSVEEQKRFLQKQPIVDLPFAYAWRVATYEGSGRPCCDKWWIVELLQFYSNYNCNSEPIDPDST